MTHIKVLYLKPNFSLEKVISAQFLLTSGNFFGNYRLSVNNKRRKYMVSRFYFSDLFLYGKEITPYFMPRFILSGKREKEPRVFSL